MNSLQAKAHIAPSIHRTDLQGPASNLRFALLALVLAFSTFSATDAAASDQDESDNNWRFHGRLQIDGAQFDSANPLFTDDAKIRRGRLSFAGDLFGSLSMKVEYELSGSTPGPKSIYLRQKLGKRSLLTVGHFKVPVSLQTATSSRYNTFMERSLPNVGTTGYRLGAMAATYGKFWSASTGVTGGRLTDEYKVDNEGVGLFARGVLNPVRSKNALVHIGVSSEIRHFGANDSVRLRSRPESDLTDIRMVDTSSIVDLDQSTRYTVEVAGKYRSLHFQAEHMGVNIARSTSSGLDFDGWYAQAGWFITGEARRYNKRKGSFQKIKPNHSYGAWELAVRHSEIDLNSSDVFGGAQTNDAIALNYYATESIRFSLNYIEASARPNSDGVDEDVSIIQGRFQFIF